MSYDRTLTRVETYFDKTATRTWERLTSDAPVSRIRETVRRGREAMRAQMLSRLPVELSGSGEVEKVGVNCFREEEEERAVAFHTLSEEEAREQIARLDRVRAGRDEMRAQILSRLPGDLTGARVLDAGCGAGQMTAELAARGADVVAVDISPSLVEIAQRRLSPDLAARVTFRSGDMLDPALGQFDHVMAMDSLIYYTDADIARALKTLGERTSGRVVFTVAPRTPLLMTMWRVGKLFPRSDRSPTMVPHAPADLARTLAEAGAPGTLTPLERISSGFYISQAMELAR